MKRFAIILSSLLFFLAASAQEKPKPLASPQEFLERLKQETSHIQSIESDFTQEKYLDVFSEKIKSEGRFYYRQPNKIRLDYSSPFPYLMVINADRLKIVSEGKPTVINLGSNQMMKEMREMLSACMTGNLDNFSSAYKIGYFETASLYMVKIEPLSESIKVYITGMTISLDKKDLSVQTLRLSETAKDYTEYHFTNRKHNTITSDEMFTIP